MERLKKQIEFILEVDKIKNIYRQSYISDGSRKENDAEHSWHLALMSFLLSEYSNSEIDIKKVMMMTLIHDIVEIDAGDTYCYDDDGNNSKLERELKAADRIFNILPQDQAEEMRKLWDEFEAGVTPEAKFAATLDRMQPLLLNDITGGRSWREHGVTNQQVLQRNSVTKEGSDQLWDCCKEIIEKNTNEGNIRF